MQVINSKKGNLGILVPSMLVLVLAAAVLIFGLVILTALKPMTATTQGTGTNEPLLTVNYAGEYVAANGTCGFKDFVVTSIINGTNSTDTINSGNYSYDQTGRIWSTTSGKYNNSNWNVTYTYYYGTAACDASESTITGMGSFSDFWEIIVLAIVITIVIGLLLAVMSTRRVK